MDSTAVVRSGARWEVVELDDSVHVVPIDDRREHLLTMTCTCRPRVEIYSRALVIHNAYDFREVAECLNEEIIEWIDEYRDGEPVEAVIIGDRWVSYGKPKGLPDDYIQKIGKVMTLEEAMPYLTYEFSEGFGLPECTPIVVYTPTWIISVYQYDGSTRPFQVPRNPIEGYIPDMPGG